MAKKGARQSGSGKARAKERSQKAAASALKKPYRMNGGGCYPLYFRRILGNLAKTIGKRP